MRKWIIAALSCVPFVADAEKLYVQYEGTVSSIVRASLAEVPRQQVGDPVKGTLIIDSDGLVQSFDVKRESVTNLWGYVERGLGEFRRVVNFTVDRLSMTPGMCRP